MIRAFNFLRLGESDLMERIALDQRRHPRVPARLAATLSTPIMDGCAVTKMVRELSVGGCLLDAGDMMGVGRVVTLTLPLEGESVRAVAKVVYEYPDRQGNYKSGAAFVALPPEDRQTLDAYISARMTGAHAD